MIYNFIENIDKEKYQNYKNKISDNNFNYFDLRFNLDFFITCLKTIGDNQITLNSDYRELSPCIINSKNNDTILNMIMPIRK